MIKKFLFGPQINDFLRNPIPFYDFLAKFFLVLLVFSIPLDHAVTRKMIDFMALALVLSGGYSMRLKILAKNPLALMSVALYLAIYIGSLYGGNELSEVQYQLRAYTPILLPVLMVPLLHERRWRIFSFGAFMCAMAVTLFLSWVHFFWQFPWAKSTIENATGNNYIFKSHVTQNVMMSFFAVACLLLLKQQKTRTGKAVWAFVAVAALINITHMVFGRTGYATLLASLLIYIFFLFDRKYYLKAVAGLMLAVSLAALFSPAFQDRVAGVYEELSNYNQSDEVTSSGARMKYWEKSFELIDEQPIIGFGTGSWKRQFCRVEKSDKWCGAWSTLHPHNQFLHFGVQLGVFGVSIFFIYLYAIFMMARKYEKLDKVLIFGLLSALVIMSLIDVPLFIIDESRFFPAMLAVCLSGYGLSRHRREGLFYSNEEKNPE